MNSLFFKKNIFYRKRHEQLCYAVLLSFCCRVIGPEMPSAELLAAAAKLTEAQAELRYFTKYLLQ